MKKAILTWFIISAASVFICLLIMIWEPLSIRDLMKRIFMTCGLNMIISIVTLVFIKGNEDFS